MDRLWRFQQDMNGDGVVTVSDVWLWVKWLFYYPGDWLIDILTNTALGRFLEFSAASLGGGLSAVISFLAWYAFFAIAASCENSRQNESSSQ